jgi:hypothetical protein
MSARIAERAVADPKDRAQADEFDSWVAWPEWAKDAVVTDTVALLSWRDAIRLLWKRRFTLSCKTFTESVVGRTASVTRLYIEPWRSRRDLGISDGAPLVRP